MLICGIKSVDLCLTLLYYVLYYRQGNKQARRKENEMTTVKVNDHGEKIAIDITLNNLATSCQSCHDAPIRVTSIDISFDYMFVVYACPECHNTFKVVYPRIGTTQPNA